jgi:hypothetical protein
MISNENKSLILKNKNEPVSSILFHLLKIRPSLQLIKVFSCNLGLHI